mmetsp:Transcript_14234/g.35517  ORF Transcript_14234/g.35517 Transcript_14234/m.35517 type:complete len:226 (+) Transcript_14234:390-1067(+)
MITITTARPTWMCGGGASPLPDSAWSPLGLTQSLSSAMLTRSETPTTLIATIVCTLPNPLETHVPTPDIAAISGGIAAYTPCTPIGESPQSFLKKSGKNLTVMPEPSAKQSDDANRMYGTSHTCGDGSSGGASGSFSAPLASSASVARGAAVLEVERTASLSSSSAQSSRKSMKVNMPTASTARPARKMFLKLGRSHSFPWIENMTMEMSGPSIDAARYSANRIV